MNRKIEILSCIVICYVMLCYVMLCYDMLCYIILQRSTVIDSIHVDLRMNTDSLPPLKSALLKSTPDNSNKTIDDDDDSNGSSSSDDGDKVTNDTRIPLVGPTRTRLSLRLLFFHFSKHINSLFKREVSHFHSTTVSTSI